MSHTLHRQGAREGLAGDFVLLIMPENGLNDADSKQRLITCLDILLRHDPVNWGDSKNGSRFSLEGDEPVRSRIVEKETIFAVYRTPENVADVLCELKEADMGLSVVVSGLSDHICMCARRAGVTPHTVSESLGVWGKTELLPSPLVLELETMCGHGLISFQLICDLARQVAKGTLTCQKAAEQMAKCCICGVFNPVRATCILERLAEKYRDDVTLDSDFVR